MGLGSGGKGKADYYAAGQWNFYCDLCGAKAKSGTVMVTWNNLRVCAHHREVRNPQDFVRGVKDNQTVPWSRPRPPEGVCPTWGLLAIPLWALPGCAIPGLVNPNFFPNE